MPGRLMAGMEPEKMPSPTAHLRSLGAEAVWRPYWLPSLWGWVALGTLARPDLSSHWPSRTVTTSNQGSSFVPTGLWSSLSHTVRGTRATCTDGSTSLLLENFSQAVTQSSMVSTRISSGMSEC